MEGPIAYDKLARDDRFVRMRARDVAQLKIDQGLPPFPDLASRDSIKDRERVYARAFASLDQIRYELNPLEARPGDADGRFVVRGPVRASSTCMALGLAIGLFRGGGRNPYRLA